MRLIVAILCLFALSCGHSTSEAPISKNNIPSKRRIASDRMGRDGFVDVADLSKNKKTVCAMTINSDEEILTFRESLSERDFQFVELYNNEDPDWLQGAADKGVKCDILVISGHFGGEFFGKNGSLSLESLEDHACMTKNAGLFHSVKEVFLFGCNTLAGKERDRRTPEEYRRVLLADDFTPAQADQVTALRYSPIGESFAGRMSLIFAGVPRIYGFSSIAPSGANVQPLLENYLSKIKDYSSYLDKVDNRKNDQLFKSLKVTAITQIDGGLSVGGLAQCFLKDQDISESKKVDWIYATLKDPKKRLTSLREISSYLTKGKRSSGTRMSDERKISKIVQDKALAKEMNKMVMTGLKEYPSLRLQLTEIARYFGWLSNKEVRQVNFEEVGKKFSDKEITREEVDQVCSLQITAPDVVTYEMIRKTQLSTELLEAISCLHTRDSQTIEWLITLLNNEDRNIRASAAQAVGASGIQSEATLKALSFMLKSEEQSRPRNAAAKALTDLRVKDGKWAESFVDALEKERSEEYVSKYIRNLTTLDLNRSVYMQAINKSLVKGGYRKTVLMAGLDYFAKKMPEGARFMAEYISKEKDMEKSYLAIEALEATKTTDHEVQMTLFRMFEEYSDALYASKTRLLELFGNMNFTDPKFLDLLVSYAEQTEGSEPDAALKSLARMNTTDERVVQLFLRALNSPSVSKKVYASFGLLRNSVHHDKGVQSLLQMLKSEKSDTRSYVLYMLTEEKAFPPDTAIISQLKQLRKTGYEDEQNTIDFIFEKFNIR